MKRAPIYRETKEMWREAPAPFGRHGPPGEIATRERHKDFGRREEKNCWREGS